MVLDPGHGGTDPGSVGHNGLLEKILTLEIANRVRDLLRSHPGIQVKLTRETDRGFSRDNRVRHIQAAQGDLLVSLHLNNLPQKDLTVVETFYADRDNIIESEIEREAIRDANAKQSRGMLKVAGNPLPDYTFTQQSKRIAELLQRHIYSEVVRNNPAAVDNGVKTDTLYTLTRSRIPAALIELTCLSNKSEEQRLKSADYRQKISVSIAEALIEYFASLDAPQSI